MPRSSVEKETETQPPGTATVANSPADVAERRQITVLFSDLVGSTVLSTRMDPEDLQKLISAYQKCVTETVRRFGGFVAKYMGDDPADRHSAEPASAPRPPHEHGMSDRASPSRSTAQNEANRRQSTWMIPP